MLGLLFIFAASRLTCGVTGNTSDSGSEESRFEPWQVNQKQFQMNSKACKSVDFQAFF